MTLSAVAGRRVGRRCFRGRQRRPHRATLDGAAGEAGIGTVPRCAPSGPDAKAVAQHSPHQQPAPGSIRRVRDAADDRAGPDDPDRPLGIVSLDHVTRPDPGDVLPHELDGIPSLPAGALCIVEAGAHAACRVRRRRRRRDGSGRGDGSRREDDRRRGDNRRRRTAGSAAGAARQDEAGGQDGAPNCASVGCPRSSARSSESEHHPCSLQPGGGTP